MDYKITDYSEFHKDNIRMSQEDWNKAKDQSNEEIMRVYWERIKWEEGYLDRLKELPLEEQINYFVVQENSEYSRSSYGECEKSQFTSGSFIPLKDYKQFRTLIVKEGVIVGAMVANYYHDWTPIYPGASACIYWSIDSDGTGSSSSNVYVHLYCLPFEDKEK